MVAGAPDPSSRRPATALLIVDHGSRRAEANALLTGIAELVRTRAPGLIVHIAHMELAPPDIAEGIDACVRDGAERIVVHPYMLGPGRHAIEDIPRLAAAAAARHPDVTVEVSAPLGLHGKLAEVILERAGLDVVGP